MSKKTVKAIVVGGNDYVIQVKGNQPKLKKAIEEYTEKNNINDKYINKEKNRGRIENREICVYKSVEGIEFAKWVGLKGIIVVHRWGERGKKIFDQTHYYISSRKNTTAAEYGKGIRQHWGIENKLHWVKDVILYEDKSLVKDKELAESLSILRIIVMNLYRLNSFPSIKYAIEKFTNKINECCFFIYN